MLLRDPTPPPPKTTADDARAALTNLGFSSRAARVAVGTAAAHLGPNPSFDTLIRAALQAPPPPRSPAADALAALTNLGFSPHDARVAVETAAAALGDQPSVDTLLRAALRTFPKPR